MIVVMILLVAALYPAMRWRLVIACGLVLLVPFAAQHPAYVMEQYRQCLAMFAAADEFALKNRFAQLFGMLRVGGVDIPAHYQWPLRCAAALLTLGAAFRALRLYSPRQAAIFLYALSATYIVLFNPRTENATYALLGPAIGVFFAQAIAARRSHRAEAETSGRPHDGSCPGAGRYGAAAALLAAMAVGAAGSYEIGKLFTRSENAIWLAPCVACGFAAFLIVPLAAGAGRQQRDPYSV